MLQTTKSNLHFCIYKKSYTSSVPECLYLIRKSQIRLIVTPPGLAQVFLQSLLGCAALFFPDSTQRNHSIFKPLFKQCCCVFTDLFLASFMLLLCLL